MVSAAQLRKLGLDRYAVRRQLQRGCIHQIHHGVYAVGHRSLSTHGRYMAAVLAGGPHAALSHRAAGHVIGLLDGPESAAITVPHGRGSLPRGLEVHRSRMLLPADITTRDGLPITTVAWTLLDLAATSSPRRVARLVDRAERLELFDLRGVDEVLGRARGRRGAKALREAVAAWRPRHTRSELEDRFADLVAAELPPPQFNVLVWGEREQHEVDAFWPDHGLIVQLDGFAYHRTRRDRERDAATDADLELAGHRVVRLTWDSVVVHGNRTLRRLRLSLAGRSPQGRRRS